MKSGRVGDSRIKCKLCPASRTDINLTTKESVVHRGKSSLLCGALCRHTRGERLQMYTRQGIVTMKDCEVARIERAEVREELVHERATFTLVVGEDYHSDLCLRGAHEIATFGKPSPARYTTLPLSRSVADALGTSPKAEAGEGGHQKRTKYEYEGDSFPEYRSRIQCTFHAGPIPPKSTSVGVRP